MTQFPLQTDTDAWEKLVNHQNHSGHQDQLTQVIH